MSSQETPPERQEQSQQPGRESVMHPRPEYAPRFPGSGRLQDKVALISGGDSGIGRATAILFAREGARIAILYKGDQEKQDAEETCRLIEEENGEVFAQACDVAEKAEVEAFVSEAVQKFGSIDVVVSNAAEQHFQKDLISIPEEQMKRTFQTNMFGCFNFVQAAMPHLKENASIICTTSITAYRGQPVLIDYSATKGAVLAFVRALASNLASKGIRVNGVAPGPIWTPLIPASFPAEQVEKFGKSSPMGRPGQPNEVAPSLLFLACADSSYMTGQVLHPNGGDPVAS